jgi:branched-subunit amino acid aminotransferase/4-amino-4-deoxychorismate lyase
MKTLIYLNGKLIPEEDARISIWDIGFMYSAVFMEAGRTFKHRIYRLDDHLARMDDTMRYAGLKPLVSKSDMASIVERTVEANMHLFLAGDTGDRVSSPDDEGRREIGTHRHVLREPVTVR